MQFFFRKLILFVTKNLERKTALSSNLKKIFYYKNLGDFFSFSEIYCLFKYIFYYEINFNLSITKCIYHSI